MLGLGVDQQDGKVEREPGDVGERVGRVDGQGREHREDPVPEHPVQPLLLPAVELVPPHDGDALLDQGGADLVLEHAGMPCHQVVGDQRDVFENLARFQTGGGAHGQAGRDTALEAGHADHEELVEVAGEDGQIAGAFQQRLRLVGGQLQDALVELQPGDLTVEEAVLGQCLGVDRHARGRDQAHEAAVRGPGCVRAHVPIVALADERRANT